MRSHGTAAEIRLWEELKDRRFLGLRFRRQHVVGQFVLDFYCSAARLAVEVDGDSHSFRQVEDSARDNYLTSVGLRVFRVSNEMVLSDTASVLSALENFIARN